MTPNIGCRLLLLLLLTATARVFAANDVKVIDLWPEGVYEPTAPTGTAVIYAPGGSYQRVAAGVNGG